MLSRILIDQCIGIEAKCTDSEREVRCESIIGTSRYEFKKIEIPAQCRLGNRCVEAEISLTLVIVGIVSIGISQPRNMPTEPQGNMITELFSEENAR